MAELKPKSIELPEEVGAGIKHHAVEAYPHECCGFLFGQLGDDDTRYVESYMKVDNTRTENRERRFEISASDYQKAELKAIQENKDLLGVYHSHPDNPARPSEYDRSQALPVFSYIIMETTTDAVENITSWRLDEEEKFIEESVNEKQKTEI